MRPMGVGDLRAMGDRMAGTEIDTAVVAGAGGKYSTVADNLGTSATALRAGSLSSDKFGREYADEGEQWNAAITALAARTDAWRDAARAMGVGLNASAAAHKTTDTTGAADVKGAGRG
ncbi:hypothetical protein GCM10009551_089030 [Nocardiopsis tropica]